MESWLRQAFIKRQLNTTDIRRQIIQPIVKLLMQHVTICLQLFHRPDISSNPPCCVCLQFPNPNSEC